MPMSLNALHPKLRTVGITGTHTFFRESESENTYILEKEERKNTHIC